MKDKIVLYGTKIDSLNRGVGALTYGLIEILIKNHKINTIYNLIISKKNDKKSIKLNIRNQEIEYVEVKFDWKLFIIAIFQLPLVKITKIYSINPIFKFFKDVKLFCVVNGGDSYTDIYGLERLFLEFITIILSELIGLRVIFAPQTIGPFNTILGKIMGAIPLKLASKIYTRDNKGESFLSQIRVKSEQTKDMSIYMLPQKANYIVKPNSIGLNINGLMWENNYTGLENCFDCYKILLMQITDFLLENNYNILLIPHTYSVTEEFGENDYKATMKFLQNYKNEERISYLDKEYTSPELKYIISQTEFFIGSRMHSNLAALTTSTPTVALSYSYKFEGTFNMFNVPECVINAKNIAATDVPDIINKISILLENRENIKQKLSKVNSNIAEFNLV